MTRGEAMVESLTETRAEELRHELRDQLLPNLLAVSIMLKAVPPRLEQQDGEQDASELLLAAKFALDADIAHVRAILDRLPPN